MTATDVVARGEGWHVRLAGPEDNDALLRLMREIPMGGAVGLAQDRSPDFFASSRMHLPGFAETGIAIDETTGEAVGCGTYVMREAWWPDGERRPVGYLCDLRVRPSHRGARIVPAWGRGAYERARDRHDTHVFLTSFVATNPRMRGLATSRRAARSFQPVSLPMCGYSMVNVQVAGRPRAPALDVRQAEGSDIEALVGFLSQRQRARAFGYVFDRKLLETRLAHWAGLALTHFLIAFDTRGELVGCCAPWDASGVRRNLVTRWSAPLAAYRAAFNLVAPLARAQPLPAQGKPFRFSTLSHLEVRDDDPRVMRALLDAALREAHARRLHFVGAMVVDGSPMERAFRGRIATRTKLVMSATVLPESPWATHDFATTRPGFEMALA